MSGSDLCIPRNETARIGNVAAKFNFWKYINRILSTVQLYTVAAQDLKEEVSKIDKFLRVFQSF